ncbi:MAG: hypothetical protein ACOX5Z_03405 [Desulfobulbus sp.]
MEHRVQIMGILNTTPDSFSDGGKWRQEAALDERIAQLIREGRISLMSGESNLVFCRQELPRRNCDGRFR